VLLGVQKSLSDPFGHWFDDQRSEIIDSSYPINVQFFNGATELPPSLTKKGSLIRLGPSVLNTGKTNYTNYIDGFGRISKWEFGSGTNKVMYQSAMIKSTLWNNSNLGTDIPPHITSEKTNPSGFEIVQLDNMDNTDVFPYRFPTQKDTVIISTDFSVSNKVHYSSLRALGSTTFNDKVKGTFAGSHTAEYIDSVTGKLYRVGWLGQKDLTGTSMTMYKMGDDFVRQVVGTYHLGYLPYSIHQTVVVGDYGIIYASPVKLKFLATGFDACISCSISDNLDSEDSQWLIFDLKSKNPSAKPIAVINTPKASNFFVFHYSNVKFAAGSKNRKIELDTCAYNTMNGVLGDHVLGNLKDVMSVNARNSLPYFCDSVKRVTLDLDAKTISSRVDLPLVDKAGNKYRVELLSMNDKYLGKENCYAYALTFHAAGSARYEDMAVLKVDLCTAASVAAGKLPSSTATVELFSQANVYLGEPIFVPSLNAVAEDDGHLLIISRDGNDNKTKLLVVDAKTMTLTASATAPFNTMFEFHGAYFADN
jgi:carotenoid cleavage dioxygenase-like enzyme